MKNIKTIGIIFAPLLVLGVMLLMTNPYDLHLAFLIVPFVLIALFVFRFCRYLLGHAGVGDSKSKFTSGMITTLLLLLMLLQSIRQLTVKDLLIMAALLAGLTFYFKRVDL